jgi:HTH-type transcriptional regulator/antitoxin HigA
MRTATVEKCTKTHAKLGLRPFPIRSEEDYDRAVELIEPLVVKSKRTREETDFLEIVTTLIEKYEEIYHPIGTSHLRGTDVLRHLLEENGLTGADLGRILGTRTQGYPILRGERDLTKQHMVRLGEYFGVPPGVFF